MNVRASDMSELQSDKPPWALRAVACALAIAGVGITTVWLVHFPPASPQATAASTQAVESQPSRGGSDDQRRDQIGAYLGIASCASDRCHGGPQQGHDTWRKAYSLWFHGYAGNSERPADPHQHAYARLRAFDPRSQGYQMVARLAPQAVETETSYRHYLAQRCDGCHLTPAPTGAAAAAFSFGVACESCHGPAGGWLVEHTTRQWLTMSDDEKRRRQFYVLTDLNDRATTCVGCHVGHPAGTELEVDHALIAAGHPRMNFDLRTYHEHLPAHWDRASDEQPRAAEVTFSLALWQAGRRAELTRALALLEARAQRAVQSPEKAHWPEFAEYSCYACHHELARGAFRQVLQRPGNRPGQPDWAAWHSVYLEFLPDDVRSPLVALSTELNQPLPDVNRVLQLCQDSQAKLALADTDVDRLALKQQLASDAYGQLDWDRAKRWWSAWLAVTNAMAEAPVVRQQIESTFFRTDSAAKPMNDREYSGILELRFQSPVHFDPVQFERQRQQAIDAGISR